MFISLLGGLCFRVWPADLCCARLDLIDLSMSTQRIMGQSRALVVVVNEIVAGMRMGWMKQV